MTWPETEPWSPRPLINTLPTRLMNRFIYIYIYIYIYWLGVWVNRVSIPATGSYCLATLMSSDRTKQICLWMTIYIYTLNNCCLTENVWKNDANNDMSELEERMYSFIQLLTQSDQSWTWNNFIVGVGEWSDARIKIHAWSSWHFSFSGTSGAKQLTQHF